MKEREISLVSVLGEVLRYRYRILIFLFIGMVAGILIGNRKSAPMPIKNELELKEELSFESRERVHWLCNMEEAYQKAVKQYEESPLISMQGEEAWHGVLYYTTLNVEIAKNIIKERLYTDGDNAQSFANILPSINGEYLKDLVYIVQNNDNALKDLVYTIQNDGGYSICIEVIQEDEKNCLLLMEQIGQILSDLETMEGVELKLRYEKSPSNDAADIVRKHQLAKYQEIVDQQEDIDKLKDELTDNELLYYNAAQEAKNPQMTQTNEVQEEVQNSSFSYKYLFIGGMGAAFIYICWIAFHYILNNKVKSEDNMQQMYQVLELQTIVQNSGKRQGIFDKQILKWRCHLSELLDEKETVALAARQIITLLGSRQKVAIWEWTKDERTETIVASISDDLKAVGKQGIIENFPMNDAKKLERLAEPEDAVLIIQDRTVSYEEIAKTVRYLKMQEKRIWGVVKII